MIFAIDTKYSERFSSDIRIADASRFNYSSDVFAL